MYEYGYDEPYFEPSEIDNLLDEFKEKCRELILPNIQEEMDCHYKKINRLEKENKELKDEIRQFKNDIEIANKNNKSSNIVNRILSAINKENITDFISTIYKKDYSESWADRDTPLWLGLLTEYYSHKEEIIELLKMFDIKLPNDIDNFRLPVDWNEEELDIFFDTMGNHYNCNGSTYGSNLRFWGGSSLKSVKEQCNHQYSEIPWQFVLRSPLLKKEKYLKLMGKMMLTKGYSSNGQYFARICDYQGLTNNQVKVILNNMDYKELKNLKSTLGEFILKYVELIDNNDFLDKIYPIVKEQWHPFSYIQKMPVKYIKKYLLENKKEALTLLSECNSLSKEDKEEIIKGIL